MIKKDFIKIFTLSLIFKLIFSAWLPLFSDETYYWVWSNHLQLSYFDHPPMISWLFYLGHFLEPLFNAVRWPAVILGHLSFFIWYLILKDHLEFKNIKLWFYLALFTPLTGMGSMILTPDLPLIFFWSLSLLAMVHLISNYKQPKVYNWYILLGVALGLSFCSKYHAVLFIPCMLIWLTWKKKWSKIQFKYIPLTIIFGILLSMPVLIWNYQNDWQSFSFQLNHGLGKKVWNPQWTLQYSYGQLLLIFPTIFIFSLNATFRKSIKTNYEKLDWLPFFSWIPLIFFFFTSFKGRVEANWPSILIPSIIALAIFAPYSRRWLKATILFWGTSLLIVSTQIQFQWTLGNTKKIKTSELTKYKPLYKIAKSYTPFFANTFQMASKISYEIKKPIYKLKGMTRLDFYDSLKESMPTEGIYFLAAKKWEKLPKWAIDNSHTVINKFPLYDDYTLFQVQIPK